MASQGVIYDQFRQRLRDERERRGWSQQKVADLLAAHGSRGIRLDMLWAFADIYGVSVDALLGRSGRSGDLAWAVSKLASNAQKAATEVDMVAHRLRTEYDEVRAMCRNDELPLLEVGGSALMQLSLASSALSHLADQFPLPTAG
jgi:transcriptional regulator with XRE-family HTH domain